MPTPRLIVTPADLAFEFPQPEDLIYLNHAGVSPWPRRAALAVPVSYTHLTLPTTPYV